MASLPTGSPAPDRASDLVSTSTKLPASQKTSSAKVFSTTEQPTSEKQFPSFELWYNNQVSDTKAKMGPKKTATSAPAPAGQPTQPPTQPVPPPQIAPSATVLPVNRRNGYSPLNRNQPTRRPQTPAEEMDRIEALRNQLQHPWALPEMILRFYLTREGWDVNRAAQAFGAANSNPLPGAPRIPHRCGRTVESSRRRFTRDTARNLRSFDAEHEGDARARGASAPPQLLTTGAILVLILQDNHWVPQAIVNDLGRRKGDYGDVVDRLNRSRLPTVTVAERDERLAAFITITGTESWDSARVFLDQRGYDLAVAVDSWLRGGNVPIVTPPTRVNTLGERVSEIPNDGMRGFSFNDNDFIPLNAPRLRPSREDDEEPDAWPANEVSRLHEEINQQRAAQGSGYTQGPRQRDAYVIDEDRRPARINCPDPTKLRIEVIQDQKYKVKYFSGQGKVNGQSLPFRWDDGPASTIGSQVEFDWANPEHITSLNRWRQETFRRGTGELAREEAIPFNKYENDWLREQEAIRTEEYFYRIANQDPNELEHTDQDQFEEAEQAFGELTHQLPLSITGAELTRLTRDFNATFQGKMGFQKVTDLGNGRRYTTVKTFTRRRPARTEAAIRTQRPRIATLCRHFVRKASQAHGGEVDPNGLVSDDDSDIEKGMLKSKNWESGDQGRRYEDTAEQVPDQEEDGVEVEEEQENDGIDLDADNFFRDYSE